MHLQIGNFRHILRYIRIIILIIPLNIFSIRILVNDIRRDNLINTITGSIKRKLCRSYLKRISHIISIYYGTITIYNNMLTRSQSYTTIPISVLSLKNILPSSRAGVNRFNKIHTRSTSQPRRRIILYGSSNCRITRRRSKSRRCQIHKISLFWIYSTILKDILNILQNSNLRRTFAGSNIRRIILHRWGNLRKAAKRYIAYSSKRNGCLEYN